MCHWVIFHVVVYFQKKTRVNSHAVIAGVGVILIAWHRIRTSEGKGEIKKHLESITNYTLKTLPCCSDVSMSNCWRTCHTDLG